jgi:hypothetical protein
MATLLMIIHQPFNQSMKPTTPWRNEFRVFAAMPWISSRCPANLVRFASSRSRTPAVVLSNASRGLSLFSLEVDQVQCYEHINAKGGR